MGVPLTGTITQYPNGHYPTHNASTGADGWRSVADHAARNAIPDYYRVQGMPVITNNDGLIWILNAPPWTGGDGDWTAFPDGSITLTGDATGSGSGTITVTVSSYDGGTPFGTMAAQDATAVAITGGTITGLPLPTNPLDAVNKEYVDTVASGLSFVPPGCRVATTANLTATYANGSAGVGATLTNSGSQTAISIDGVSLSASDRVLVKNQASQLQNGIYTVTNIGSGSTNWVLTRATNYDQPAEIVSGSYTAIGAGTVNLGTLWIMTAADVTTVGTDPIVFTQLIATGSGTVTQVNTGSGLVGGPITTTGTVAFAAVADQSILANISGGTAAPIPNTLSAILDDILGTSRGSLIVRGASVWSIFGPGTGGYLLQTGGPSADPSWVAPTGGTVTNIATGTGLTGGPITGTGTIGIANSTPNNLVGFNNSGVFSNVAIGANLTLSGGTLSASGGGGGGSGSRTFGWVLGPNSWVVVGTNQSDLVICTAAGTFSAWFLACKKGSPPSGGPVGAALILDFLISTDGGTTFTSLWHSNPSNRPTIADGQVYGTGTSFDITSFAAGNLIRQDTIQVGSTTAGSNLSAAILGMLS